MPLFYCDVPALQTALLNLNSEAGFTLGGLKSPLDTLSAVLPSVPISSAAVLPAAHVQQIADLVALVHKKLHTLLDDVNITALPLAEQQAKLAPFVRAARAAQDAAAACHQMSTVPVEFL